MRVWLSMIALLVGLALVPVPIAAAFADANDHATHGDSKADKAMVCAVSICCSASGFAVVDHAVDMFAVAAAPWSRWGYCDHAGLRRAPELPPPRL